ncbi:MAG: hypothetical protein JWR26_597 [Pedosphaera sp.]|nr:hypothetical protein [Pedosphaera sp.]
MKRELTEGNRMNHLSNRAFGKIFAALWLSVALAAPAATDSRSMALASKWGRFEQSFRSTLGYASPLSDVSLSVVFTSPLGETTTVNGFWDGGRIWRVRFSPDQPGNWTFTTTCSDTTNTNLHHITGEFLCTPTVGRSRFDLHGPVRISKDGRHLEHQDRTPFFWLADTVWNGALLSKPKDWEYYARVRSSQKFTVAQWLATPGGDLRKQIPYTGNEHILLHPDYFRQLDAKIESLERDGILSAIVPLWEIKSQGSNTLDNLPETQAILLLRYLVARWGAHNVVWELTCEGDTMGGKVGRWKRIGRAVFGDAPHAVVILNPGETYWTLEEFRTERWVSVFGYQSGQETSDDASQWLLAGPVSKDWRKEPARPFINLAPPFENAAPNPSPQRTDPHAVRRAAYWSLCNAPASGVSYGADGVPDWRVENKVKLVSYRPQPLPTWQKALFLPAARQMGILADALGTTDFRRLVPAQELVASQPGLVSPSRYIAAMRSDSGDVAMVYIPEDRTVELVQEALPLSPLSVWINPRTGEHKPAEALKKGAIMQFTTPEAGDWLLRLNGSMR